MTAACQNDIPIGQALFSECQIRQALFNECRKYDPLMVWTLIGHYIVGVNCATMISQTGISLETKCVLLIGLGLDAECGPLIGQIGLSLDPDWSLARVFISNPSLPVGYTVEPLYNGHHWDPTNVRYSEVSPTQGLSYISGGRGTA